MKRFNLLSVLAVNLLAAALLGQAAFADGWSRIYPANQPTYYAISAAYAGYATPTDFACIKASATRTIKIINAFIAPGATSFTAADFYFVKRSTLDAGGTAANFTTPWVNSSTQNAPTTTPVLYSVIPTTLGTVVGNLIVSSAAVAKATTAPSVIRSSSDFQAADATTFSDPINLQPGSTEEFCINFNGVALPSGFTATIGFEWNER